MGCIILIPKHLFLVPNFKINVIHWIYGENIINNIRLKKHFHNKNVSEVISLASKVRASVKVNEATGKYNSAIVIFAEVSQLISTNIPMESNFHLANSYTICINMLTCQVHSVKP